MEAMKEQARQQQINLHIQNPRFVEPQQQLQRREGVEQQPSI